MPARRKDDEQPRSRRLPARTFEAEEDRVIDKAVRLAEQQIDEGTVSSQVLNHYLRLGSSREKLEKRYMESQIELNRIKAETVQAAERMEEAADRAVKALSRYQGRRPPEEDDDYDD